MENRGITIYYVVLSISACNKNIFQFFFFLKTEIKVGNCAYAIATNSNVIFVLV